MAKSLVSQDGIDYLIQNSLTLCDASFVYTFESGFVATIIIIAKSIPSRLTLVKKFPQTWILL